MMQSHNLCEKSKHLAGNLISSTDGSYFVDNMHNIMDCGASKHRGAREESAFGGEASVFKVVEKNIHNTFIEHVKNEALHFEESKEAVNELAEIGLSEENLHEFVQLDASCDDTLNVSQEILTFNQPLNSETKSAHEDSRVPIHPVSLQKSRDASNVTGSSQNTIPGQITTLLDLSSIGELKRLWAKSDRVTKKSGPSVTYVKPDIKEAVSEHKQDTDGCHLDLDVREASQDLSNVHIKDCEVSLVRVENLCNLTSGKILIDLTLPKMCAMRSKPLSSTKRNMIGKVNSSRLGKAKANTKTVRRGKIKQKSFIDAESRRSASSDENNMKVSMKKQSFDKQQKNKTETDTDCGEITNEHTPTNLDNRDGEMLQIVSDIPTTEADEENQNMNGHCPDEVDDDDYYNPSDDDDEEDDEYKPSKKLKKSKSKKKHVKHIAKSVKTTSKCTVHSKKLKGTRIGRPPVLGHFTCKVCDFTANEKNLVDKHYFKEHRTVLYCGHCNKKFKSMNGLLEHKAYNHDGGKPFKCDHEGCPYASKNPLDLERHKSKHETDLKHVCQICGWRTRWRRNLKHHFTLKHCDERNFKCHICEFAAKRASDLKEHIYRHTDEKPLQCKLCHFRVKTNFELKSHMLVHSDERPFKCTFPGCTSATKTKSDLTKHQRVHQTDRPFPCKLCGKFYKCQMSLNKHLTYIHVDTRKFKCDLCGKDFKNRFSLKKHMTLHSGIKPFECPVCQWKFSNKNNMEKHMVTHDSKNRPYPCPLCPHTAKQQDHLLAHIGYVHGNEYAYVCELCRKPFKKYMQLKLHHERMHTKNEIEKLKKTAPVDLALMKMEMELEKETSRIRRRKKGSKNKDSCDIDIKEEPVDEEYGNGAKQDDEIRDIRLNENTGQIEFVKRSRPGAKRIQTLGNKIRINKGENVVTKMEKNGRPLGVKTSLNIIVDELKVVTDEREICSDSTCQTEESKAMDIDTSNRLAETEVISDSNSASEVVSVLQKTCDTKNRGETCREKFVDENHTVLSSFDEGKLIIESNNKIAKEKGSVLVISDDTESEDTPDVTVKNSVENEEMKDDKVLIVKNDVVTVGVYDNFRLPLATRGFRFNYDKNGTKPMKAWFMDVSLMDPKTAEKHKKHRRRIGLLPPIPRGHPPKGYKGLKKFVTQRKKKLAENIKKAKFIKDLGLVSRRKSQTRGKSFKGNYAEFETVAGEELSYTQVQERLPAVTKLESENRQTKTLKDTKHKGSMQKKNMTNKNTKTQSSNAIKKMSKCNQKPVMKIPKRKLKKTESKALKLRLSSEKQQKRKTVGKPIRIRKPNFLQPANDSTQGEDKQERDSFSALQSILAEFSQPATTQEKSSTVSNRKFEKKPNVETKTKNISSAYESKKSAVKRKEETKPKYDKKYVPVKQRNKRKPDDMQINPSAKKMRVSLKTGKAKTNLEKTAIKLNEKVKQKLKVKIASKEKSVQQTFDDKVTTLPYHVPVENTNIVMVYPVHSQEMNELDNLLVTVNDGYSLEVTADISDGCKPFRLDNGNHGDTKNKGQQMESIVSGNSDRDIMQKEYLDSLHVKVEPQSDLSDNCSLEQVSAFD